MNMGPDTRKEVEAISREAAISAAVSNRHKRATDSPREQFTRFIISMVWGVGIAAVGVVLRINHLIGEWVLMAIIIVSGIVVKGESLVNGVRAWRRDK